MKVELKLTLPSNRENTSGKEITVRFESADLGSRQDIPLKTNEFTLSFVRSRDGVLDGISNFYRDLFSSRGAKYFRFDKSNRLAYHKNYQLFLTIGSLPLVINKKNGIYRLNGIRLGIKPLSYLLARLSVKASNTDDLGKMMITLNKYLNLSEDVRYCLENRVPYHFFHEWSKVEVRLNVRQIGDKELAIEISDGLWGSISTRDLELFCGFYLHGKKRTAWSNCSPSKLFQKLIGRKPTESELHLMVEFLKQNRTSDMVEERAYTLLRDLGKQYSNRISITWDNDDFPTQVLVRGKIYDWKLTANNRYNNTTSLQSVNTYIFSNNDAWDGPICIDNISTHSPVGDQYATRILSFLNDTLALEMIGTLSRYRTESKNENRNYKGSDECNELFGMWEQ